MIVFCALAVACGSPSAQTQLEAQPADDVASVPPSETTAVESSTTAAPTTTPGEPTTTSTTATTASTPTTSTTTTDSSALPPEQSPVEDTATTSQPADQTATTSQPTDQPATTSESTTAPSTATTIAAVEPTVAFGAAIFEISDAIEQRMAHSWREGCPVGLEELRLITLNHWDYSGEVASGELIVHADHAQDMVLVFSRLYDAQFPIERMELVDNYLGDDDLSMAANNTSAFNCREIALRPGSWSNHAFGAAVDINPLNNPYVAPSGIFPPEGAAFADRAVQVTGGIYPGDVVTQAFAEIGWGWGGDWSSAKDWQHFSASGN